MSNIINQSMIDISETYNNLINELGNTLNEVLDIDNNLFNLNDRKLNMYDNVADSVYNAVDDKGKSLYSNQEKRDLAIKTTLNLNTDYISLINEIRVQQERKNRLNVKSEILKYKLKLNGYSLNYYSNLNDN
jgi:hypothetical protein